MTPAELDAIEARAKGLNSKLIEIGILHKSAIGDASNDNLALVAEVRRLQAENDRLGELAPDWVPLPNHGGP